MTCTVEITLHALSQRSPAESIGKGQKLIEAARPEGAEALSPGQRPGFVGVSLTPCKGKSFKKHLIKNENSLRYVKLPPLLLYLHLEK